MTGLPDTGRSRAVLVGTGRYQVLSELGSVHNNLSVLTRALRDERVWGLWSGNCAVVEDPASTRDILDPVAKAAREATDTLLLYYAGHGLVDPKRGELHLTLTGSDPELMYTAVWYSLIRDLLLDSRARRKIVILDCCYSGRALGQMGSAGEAIATEASAEGTYVLAAVAENKTAVAPPGALFTAFTGELLNIVEHGISGQGPLLDLDSIYRELLAVMRAKGYPSPQKRDRNTAGQLTLIRNQAYIQHPAEPAEHTPTPMAVDSAPRNESRSARQAPVSPETASTPAQAAARAEPGQATESVSPAPAIGAAQTGVQPVESLTPRANAHTLPAALGNEAPPASPHAISETAPAAQSDKLIVHEDVLPDQEASAPPPVAAEWALWGKEAHESGYHVLRCSKGTFMPDDFDKIITRYASGPMDDLPQYTVCWIPGIRENPGYLAIAVHELASADPRQSEGRSRYDAHRRKIEFIRLFCVRYEDLAQYAVSYRDLAEAVQDLQLPPGPTDPIPLGLPPRPSLYRATSLFGELANNVATLLLTTRPVCVLGADRVPTAERLGFIDMVMSLLPYGLRASLSASTWASSTRQDLKLRLYFSSAKRDDGGRTLYVTWGQPGPVPTAGTEGEVTALYLRWLNDVGPRAPDFLAEQLQPTRFTAAEIRQMVAKLPRDETVTETLDELAESLDRRDVRVVTAAVRQLKRHLASHQEPVDREYYRQLITRHGLLKDQPELHPSTRKSLYRALIQLAFDVPLSYASYCQIEDCAGRSSHGALADVMTQLEFSDYLSWILAHMATDPPDVETVLERLRRQGVPPADPLDMVERYARGPLRPAHAKITLDFAVRYLLKYSDDPRTELANRGYLAQLYEIVFADEPTQQLKRLVDVLMFVYGGSLSRRQIADILVQPGNYPTVALHAAVAQIASPEADRDISERATDAKRPHAGSADESASVQHSTRLRSLFRAIDLESPRATMIFALALAATLALIGFLLFLSV